MVARRTQPPLTSSGDDTSGGAGDKGITPHRKPKDKRQARERALQVRPPPRERLGMHHPGGATRPPPGGGSKGEGEGGPGPCGVERQALEAGPTPPLPPLTLLNPPPPRLPNSPS